MMRLVAWSLVALLAAVSATPSRIPPPQARGSSPARSDILAAMKRATTFMIERVSTNGGFVWAYLPDLSRRWGEIEARPSIVWIQPPGTATVGHLFLDAYHATGDEYYYQAAEKAAGVLVWAQHPSGGWNYVADLAGEQSLRDWYGTVGKNAWRLEEFQHHWGNATFDDVVTVDAARLLLRVYLEKRDPKYKPPLDKAIQFVLDSQYPIGGWPQRFPPKADFVPDYTAYITFNDDVAAENIDFLLQCYQTLGDKRLVDAILRGMQAFIVLQQGPPQAGWALQYTPDFKPAGARTYEPLALVTHTTARNIELLIRFYRLTGDRKFLARVPEAIDWLAGLTLPAGVAPAGRTHPTFVEIGTNRPLYVHREGSNVVNGRYFVNYDPAKTIGHYSAFRRVDVSGLRKLYDEARALSPAEATRGSPLLDPAAPVPLRFVALDPAATESAADVIAGLRTDGAWIAPLEYVSHPYRGDGPKERPAGDFSQTHVGDDSDTSPFPNTTVLGISTTTYIRRMSVLIRALEASPAAAGGTSARDVVTWRLDNLDAIGGHPVTRLGTPRVVATAAGPAIEFNGRTDGLVIETNPLEGLRTFTLEAEFEPAAGGPEEQRFLHIEEHETGNRALIETRLLPDGHWSLDTFLNSGQSSRTLIDRTKTHAAGQWHVAALVYDGVEMRHYVDGVLEASGPVSFAPLGPGRTALGVRLNQVSWFQGRLRLVRVTPEALPANRLLKKPDARISQAGTAASTWARGIERQRKADLGNGFFLNPIMAGDHPDPTVLKDGSDYYMTSSSFDAYPGLVIWHSRDLVNWAPVGAALTKNVGSVWAPDLVKHNGRYYIYFPGVGPYRSNYVIWADSIRGPWSDPIDLKVGRIDPGHAVGPDGKRFLFLSNGELAPLSDDGLSVTGPAKRIYEGWKYPDDWIVESFSQEGPKILKRGEYYYMVLAEGGTAGPPTGHMIVAARSNTIEGPWENSPYNPIVRTRSAAERWWSKGHGTLVEGPDGRWFIVYHAYENGFYTLGRQTLLEPVEWTPDGWFRTTGSDLARPIAMPARTAGPHGQALSDDFSTNKMGIQWGFYAGTDADRARARYENGALVIRAKGQSPADATPLSFVTGDHAYEVEVTIDADPGATAGLLLFYSRRLYAGLGLSATRFVLHRYGTERLLERPAGLTWPLRLRLRNDRHIVTLSYSADDRTWTRFGTTMEVSGYHHNVAGEFLSLRPAIYAAGTGEVRFRQFIYRALD